MGLFFAFSFLYYLVRMQMKYGEIDERFKMAIIGTIVYFNIASSLMNSKLKNLWSAIIKSKKLAKEMKKLLTIFPNGVIIHSGYDSNIIQTVFSNRQFKSQILGLQKEISLFDSIEIRFKEKESFDENSISMSLKKLLINHQNKVSGHEIVHQDKVKILCHPFKRSNRLLIEEDQNDDEKVERIFNIKSMKVEWEDKPWFMHVFVDTTDFVKLEEANNSIKWQKIMFTSASHEFRTPLNAITNSFGLIDGCVEDIIKESNNLWRSCK